LHRWSRIEASTFGTKTTSTALERRLLGMNAGEESNTTLQPATKSKSFNFWNTIFKTFHNSDIMPVLVRKAE
jgi:hypothetical protein